jgi:hypothetical protein
MTESYYSLGDKLSDTDPISNSVLISGLNFPQHAAGVLRAGHYPPECLNSYIHESLHHHCFRSPVGAAISYIYHRSFLRAVDYLERGDAAEHDDYDVLDDVLRVENVLHIMRPLAEGIALFGEFDAFPGDSKSLSSVFRNTAVAFAAMVPKWQELRVSEILRGVLSEGRWLPAARRRKENLLFQGFTTKNGGYLPGYYMVKNLQFSLLRHLRCPKLIDSEFYLNFLVHWFYSDYDLVSALIDGDRTLTPFSPTSMKENDAINAISVAFQKRVGALFRLSPKEFERFDDLLVSADTVPWWKSQIGLEFVKAKEIEDRLLILINELCDYNKPGSDFQRFARSICYDNVIRREYMCIASFEEDIEILPNDRLMLSKYPGDERFPVMALGESLVPGPYKGKATFDVLQSAKSGGVFFVVYCDNKLVLIRTFAKGAINQELNELKEVNLSTNWCRHNKQMMRDVIDQVLRPESSTSIFRDYYRSEFGVAADQMYRNWCGTLMTIVGPEAKLSDEQGVLLRLCNGDTTFLRTLAALGTMGGPIMKEELIDSISKITGSTASQFKARSDEIERKHNLKLIYSLGDGFVLTI